jgi:hypothetical protein
MRRGLVNCTSSPVECCFATNASLQVQVFPQRLPALALLCHTPAEEPLTSAEYFTDLCRSEKLARKPTVIDIGVPVWPMIRSRAATTSRPPNPDSHYLAEDVLVQREIGHHAFKGGRSHHAAAAAPGSP